MAQQHRTFHSEYEKGDPVSDHAYAASACPAPACAAAEYSPQVRRRRASVFLPQKASGWFPKRREEGREGARDCMLLLIGDIMSLPFRCFMAMSRVQK
jgi:hypothetical protein